MKETTTMFNWGVNTVSIEDLLDRPLTEVEKKNVSYDKLYVKGKIECSPLPKNKKRVAIVGTRTPQDETIQDTKNIVNSLITKDFKDVIIVSGLAHGIDTIAHTEAIKAGGKTIAVLGTPLNKTYPVNNYNLQQEIMHNHLALSQFQIRHHIKPYNFILRDYTLALISDAVLIMEARGERNGSLYACWEAIRLGRPLYIWKNILMNQRLKWPSELIKYGAKVLNNLEEVKYLVL
jgi:DNA processing protein